MTNTRHRDWPWLDSATRAARLDMSEEEIAWRDEHEPEGRDDLLFGTEYSAYSHNGDENKLRNLGLKTYGFKGWDWTDLGTVEVYPAETDNRYHCRTGAKPATTIKVEVSAAPAQFWRFTITRPQDATEDDPEMEYGFRAVYEPLEVFEINTGSGGFVEYWPLALKVAEHMVNIKRVD